MWRRIKQWIAAGDIYQVNLSQAFEAEVSGGSLFGLYETLRDASPAPMAAWLALDGREVLCSSPESFLKISGRGIETRPIKGTRPRFADPDEDRRSAYELQTSAKEIAELVMITDLLRNDLGQVCEFGSVEVSEMLQLESLAQVHHLVSTVTGTLRPDIDAIDALAACFPGGSITGAPKKRAMEIIREIEGKPARHLLRCDRLAWPPRRELVQHRHPHLGPRWRPAHLSSRSRHRRRFRSRGRVRGNAPQSRRHPPGGGAVDGRGRGRAALTSAAAAATVAAMDTMKLLLGATIALLLGALAVSWQGMNSGVKNAPPDELARLKKQVTELRVGAGQAPA